MKNSKLVLVVVLVLSNMVCFADTGFEDDVQDAPLPINEWVCLLLIVGSYYGYKIINDNLKRIK